MPTARRKALITFVFRLTWVLACGSALAQLPASGALSASDRASLSAEVARLNSLRDSAADKAAVTYQLARTWAYAAQWPEALQSLREALGPKFNPGFDPGRDSLFDGLRDTPEFASILAAVRQATPPVSHSQVAFHVDEGDLVPESMAYDPVGGNFYFGSMRKAKVIRCNRTGQCTPFLSGNGRGTQSTLGTILGMKVHAGELWLLNNTEQESALLVFDLASGNERRKFAVAGSGHVFNDLAIAPDGEFFITDTAAGAIWHEAGDGGRLTRLPGRFEGANGIALAPQAHLLYVSSFPDGITVIDLSTAQATPIGRPANLCLAAIDGLYFYQDALIAIQNGFMTPRVVRFTLNRNLRSIAKFRILERRNPLFDGVTTGVIDGAALFYMANIQDAKHSGFNPIAILKLHL